MAVILKNQMAPRTLRKKLDHLLSLKFICEKSDDWKKGKKKTYHPTEAYRKYNLFIEKLEKETSDLLERIEKLEVKDETDAFILHIISRRLIHHYSIPYLTNYIISCDSDWLNDDDVMKELLVDYYTSYLNIVNKKIDKKMVNEEYMKYITEFEVKQLEKINEYSKTHSTASAFLDLTELKIYNLLKEPIFEVL